MADCVYKFRLVGLLAANGDYEAWPLVRDSILNAQSMRGAAGCALPVIQNFAGMTDALGEAGAALRELAARLPEMSPAMRSHIQPFLRPTK